MAGEYGNRYQVLEDSGTILICFCLMKSLTAVRQTAVFLYSCWCLSSHPCMLYVLDVSYKGHQCLQGRELTRISHRSTNKQRPNGSFLFVWDLVMFFTCTMYKNGPQGVPADFELYGTQLPGQDATPVDLLVYCA